MQGIVHENPGSPSEDRSSSEVLTRRHLLRRALFASLAPLLGPAFSLAQAVHSDLTAAARGEDGSKFLTDPNWQAAFLNEPQNTTLIALSDVILPATNTPGAKAALVNRYLDLLLSVQPGEFQQQFVRALEFVDGESQKQFGKNFSALTLEDQTSLLTQWAYPQQASHWTHEEEETSGPGQRHFGRLKALIAAAYYGSEIGQKELGWDGTFMHGAYQGCEHPLTSHS